MTPLNFNCLSCVFPTGSGTSWSCLGTTTLLSHTPSITYSSSKSNKCLLSYFKESVVYTSTYLYVPGMNQYILTQITLTLNFHSGTITLATLTSLLPTLVLRFAGRILPLRSLLDCQTANARLTTSKLPQPSVNLIDVAASPSILRSCVCTSGRKTCTLHLQVAPSCIGSIG